MSIERIVGPTGGKTPAQPLPRPAVQPQASVDAQISRVPTAEVLRVTVDNVNRYLKSIDQGVQFELDDTTGRTIVRIVDNETAEVIRQFPSEEMLAVARAIARLKGSLLDDIA